MERLTQPEEAVMLHIWQLKECAIKDVHDKMDDPKPPYTTVASIFANLEKKGYIGKRRFGNVKVFKPEIAEEDYKLHFLSGVVQNYFENSYKDLVSFFARERKITKAELEEIISLIEKNRK